MTRFIPRAQRAMLTARLVGGLQVALIVAGCGSSMTVHTDYDRTANFAAFKTYTWREGTKLPNPLMEQRVIDAVDAQLKAKGLTRVDTGGDVSVTYHAAATESAWRRARASSAESSDHAIRIWRAFTSAGCTRSTRMM